MAYLDGSGITKLTQEYDARYIGEPASDGTSGQVLTTDGSGGRTWQTVSGGGAQTTWYGTSSTAASTAAKVVTCSGFTLSAGAIISVLFSTANTAATPTLNINSTGAKSIYVGGTTPSATTNPLKWSANTLLTFQYDGTYFRFLGAQSAGSVASSRGAGTWYGTSSTAATTAAKAVTCANFVMTRGALISVTFSTASTVAGAITLNVNSTGAKTIYYNNAATSASNTLTWTAGETLTFIYSGSYYYYVGRSKQESGSGGASVTVLYAPTTTPATGDVELSDTVGDYDAIIITGLASDGIAFDTAYVHDPYGKTVDLTEAFLTGSPGSWRTKRLRYAIDDDFMECIVNECYSGTTKDTSNLNQCGYVLGIKY